MEKEIESRHLSTEWRVEGDAAPIIRGYGAVFNSESQDLGGFREVIAPGAFKKALQEDRGDIVSMFNHESSMLLGRTGSGTLNLKEDKRGLYYEVTPPESRMDVVESVRRGDVPGGSFQFVVVKDSWDGLDTETPTRTLNEVRLLEVGPVVMPAYLATTVSARAMEQVRLAAEKRALGGTTHQEPEPSEEETEPETVETPDHSEPAEPQAESTPVEAKSLSQATREMREEYEAFRMTQVRRKKIA